jgi:crotonobetainyl-CoA:carnitine CoA-transferase CaiB-like acyl-CoA transferase
MHSSGEPGSSPLKAGPSVCDLMGAAVSSMAVVAAVAARRPGASQFIDTALFDMGAVALTELWPLARRVQAETLRSLGNSDPRHAPSGDYACADGRLMVTVDRNAQWQALAPRLGLPATWGREARLGHREAIDAALGSLLAPLPAAQAASELQAMTIAAVPVLDLAQVMASDTMAARAMVAPADHPRYGRVPLINSPLAMGRSRGPRRPQPTLGEHNEEVIGDLLGRAGQLAELRAEGVVGQAQPPFP